MRRNNRKRAMVAVAKLLVLLACVGAARGAWATVGSEYAAPSSSATLEPLGRAHHLVWEGVNFEVSGKSSRAGNARESHNSSGSTSTRRRNILRHVSGEALPGRLLAIMGPSGSGKSSLLNVLAGRVPAARRNRLQGTVDVDGVSLHDFDTQRYVAYVRQEQSFYPFLTVKETLLITAGLRLDRGVSNLQKETLVREIMEKLGLDQIADTLVGDLRTPGISGGEKRRLAMGLQLIGLEAPSIIFLDEPTSGLDSHQALQVMTTVRDLCNEGHTVLVAIHQPRSSIYALFDDLLLLSDGMVMYHGSADKVLPVLASLGHRCPVNFNPADFMVDLISPVLNGNGPKPGGLQESEAKTETLNQMADAAKNNWEVVSAARRARHDRLDRGRRWWSAGIGGESDDEEAEGEEEIRNREGMEGGDSYGCWPHGDKNEKTPVRRGGGVRAVVPASSSGVAVSEGSRSARNRRRRRSGWPTQFGLLLKRSWRQAMRDKFAAVARVALGFGLGGVFGSVFWKLSLNESSIQNRISLFVNVAMNTAMFGCIRALQTLAVERGVVSLERIDEGYSAGAYLASKILAELPMDTVFPLIFGTTVYFAAGLNAPVGGCVKLAKFLGTLLVQAHASSAVGLMVGSLSPSMEAANLLGPAVIIVSLMLSGVHDNMPPYLEKLKVVSTLNWGLQGIVTNEMRGIKFVPDGKRLLLGWKLGTNKEVIPGEDVMQKMGFAGEGLGKPTRRLLQVATGCHLVTLLSLFVGAPKFQPLERASCPPTSPGVVGDDDQAIKNSGTR